MIGIYQKNFFSMQFCENILLTKKWSNLNKILNMGSSHAEIYSNETIF